jgi:hypothetical protein
MTFDPTKYTKVFTSFNVELCFEFNSYYSVEKTRNLLTSHLSRNVVLNNSKDFKPDNYTFQMRTNDVFSNPYIQLISGKLEYQEARFVIINMCERIKEFGYTEADNFIRVKISTTDGQEMIPELSSIDRLKYILDFDESLLLAKFNSLDGSAFLRSIYNITPINKRMVYNLQDNITPSEFNIPVGNLYGINFEKLTDESIEFNYIGGVNYEKKISEALYCLEYYLLSIAKTSTTEYNDKNKTKLVTILDDLKSVLIGYESPAKFKTQFPDLSISIDLNSDIQILNTHWIIVRDRLFELLVNSDVKKGYFNYDTSLSRFQLKQSKFSALSIEGFELIDCEINNSFISECNIYRSTIKNSRIDKSHFYSGSELSKCKIENSIFNSSTEIVDSYVYGKSTIIRGTMIGGILRNGSVANNAEIKPSVKVINFTPIKNI